MLLCCFRSPPLNVQYRTEVDVANVPRGARILYNVHNHWAADLYDGPQGWQRDNRQLQQATLFYVIHDGADDDDDDDEAFSFPVDTQMIFASLAATPDSALPEMDPGQV